MKLVGLPLIGVFLAAVTLFVILDEVDEWFQQGRRLARTSHLE